jgi:formate-dependent nitrite reductase membrane component NrfD
MMAKELGPQNVFMDRFEVEPKTQRIWGGPHATWFTLMGVGGGLFILSHLLGLRGQLGTWAGLPVDDLISFLAIAVGGLILIADLGRPMRFVRAVLNPRTSWISRGALADFVFLAAGPLLIAPALRIGGAHPFSWLPWSASGNGPAARVLEVVALLAAAVVTFYAGEVLAAPRSIPYWHSPLVPIQFVLSSLAVSTALIMTLEAIVGRAIPAGQAWLLAACLVLLAVAIARHLSTDTARPGKDVSVARLRSGPFRAAFLGGVVLGGTILPAILAVLAALVGGLREAVGVIALLLTAPAGFGLRLLTLRVGVYPPVRSVLPVR